MAPIFIPAPRYIGVYVGKCDFCGFDYGKQDMEDRKVEKRDTCCRIFPLMNDPHFGWLACESCHVLGREAMKYCTYSKEKLLEEFPGSISVMRSSGELQPGWKILSDAYRRGTEYEDEIYVEVSLDLQGSGQRILKTIPLSLLRAWNQKE